MRISILLAAIFLTSLAYADHPCSEISPAKSPVMKMLSSCFLANLHPGNLTGNKPVDGSQGLMLYEKAYTTKQPNQCFHMFTQIRKNRNGNYDIELLRDLSNSTQHYLFSNVTETQLATGVVFKNGDLNAKCYIQESGDDCGMMSPHKNRKLMLKRQSNGALEMDAVSSADDYVSSDARGINTKIEPSSAATEKEMMTLAYKNLVRARDFYKTSPPKDFAATTWPKQQALCVQGLTEMNAKYPNAVDLSALGDTRANAASKHVQPKGGEAESLRERE